VRHRFTAGTAGVGFMLAGMAQDNLNKRTSSEIVRDKSVMFSAHFEDGRIGSFVIPSHGTSDKDYKALAAAHERQRIGELPAGVIRAVKRIR
jgi:dihydroorotase-like cyclic amidohydrolase